MQQQPRLRDFLGSYSGSPEIHSGFLTAGELRVPKAVKLRGGCIRWNPEGGHTTKTVGKNLVATFADLASAEPEKILAFAREWGVLGLCEHGLPASHNPHPLPPSPDLAPGCRPSGDEHVEVWQEFAQLFRSLLSIGASLRKGLSAGRDSWRLVLSGILDDRLPSTVSEERQRLEGMINALLLVDGVRPQLRLDPAQLKMCCPVEGTLFGALVVQLMSTVVKADGFVICSACGKAGTFEELRGSRLRSPKKGVRFYCGHCQITGEPERHARQAHRERKKTKK